MKSATIAAREFRGLFVERRLWVAAAAIGLLVPSLSGPHDEVVRAAMGPALAVAVFQGPVYFLGGLTACLLTYRAVVEERENGRMKLLLGLSAGRRDVVLGKYIGRTAVLVALFVVPAVFGSVVGFVRSGGVTPVRLALFALASTLYLGAIAGIGVGASMAVASGVRSAALTFGAYLWFFLFWDDTVETAYAALAGGTADPAASPLYFFLVRLAPLQAFQALSNAVLGAGTAVGSYRFAVRALSGGRGTNLHVAEATLDAIPFYFRGWFSAFVLLAWACLPLLIGFFRFRRTDL